MEGQAIDLGGGVFKKRLNENMNRSVILSKGGAFWVYEYLFAKKDRDNIDDDELDAFRRLAEAYQDRSGRRIEMLLKNGDFLEICDGETSRFQE